MNVLRVVALAAASIVIASAAEGAPGTRRPPPVERPQRTIAVDVNGEPLSTQTPAQVVDGRVAVPLRDVFAALGLTMSRLGDTITARLPTGSVSVRVGGRHALVNGRPVPLDAPVVDRNGTTYAPLRLLVAAFGAQATYDPHGEKVEIVSAYLGRTSGAEQQREDGGTDVQGVVSAIAADAIPPAITVVRGGTARTVNLTSDAKIWTEDVTIHSQLRAALADIRVGDALHAILARDGRVVSIFDYFRSTSGTISATSPSAMVLQNGRVVSPTGTTEITLNAALAHFDDLRAGDYVTVRSNPESGELRQIVASRSLAAQTPSPTPSGAALAAAANVSIASVALSSQRPLRAGESLEVVLKGTPGGRASFDIGDYLTNLAMRESAPGVYVGRYTIPERFNVTQVPVYGKLTVGAVAAARAEAQQTLSATTTPPTIGEVAPPPGQTVNNDRPSIYATFSAPTEIAINAGSSSLVVNGHDVTSSATRNGSFITYSPGVDLPDGPVSVVVRVADSAGNTASKSWTFMVHAR